MVASFGATMVAVMPTTVPTVSSGESTPNDDKKEDAVNVTMRADASGITLKCESDTIAPDLLKDMGGKIPKANGQYDYKQITTVLNGIKKKYLASKSVVVVPDDNLPYEVIVKLLDCARDTRLIDERNAILFPDVVLSGIATHDVDGNLLK